MQIFWKFYYYIIFCDFGNGIRSVNHLKNIWTTNYFKLLLILIRRNIQFIFFIRVRIIIVVFHCVKAVRVWIDFILLPRTIPFRKIFYRPNMKFQQTWRTNCSVSMLSSICILKSIARKTAVTKTGSVTLQFQANFVKNKNDFPNAESIISFDCCEKSKNLVSRNKVELTGIVKKDRN